MKTLIRVAVLTSTLMLFGGCDRADFASLPSVDTRKLTSEWHREEEAKIDNAVNELRALGMWNEQWDKFSKLGSYGWRGNMDCGWGPDPCSSGGYTFSESALEQLKRGDESHNPHNTPEESFQQQQELHRPRAWN
jgi:hypothetical protein